ncbi:Ataxin-3 [Klebsormidium nitens]|uniref:ubiquitinyl hydrolase 1 n=1 Tax=Klebsormidium nitens TaxID=105231 RepID=A0A1Y1HM05_KLENI|nr:Ataxin-3 [Klebsormidium nitens]|eukprot:GAQ79023.1 Ataxin-3 [Klebsormidium nitens]
MEETPLLYHEKQESAICGVHALNTLLQGPYFTEVDLSQIALELDKNEREMMAESGLESSDYLKFMAEESGNVAADGNFSIQVLSKALEVWGLIFVHLDSPEAAAMGDNDQEAFLCNLQQHWFTIRKIGSEWYNMNSLYPAPVHLSQFYLAAYLGSLKDGGYTIFAVQGNLPKSVASEFSGSGQGRWLTPQQAEAINAEAKRKETKSNPQSNPSDWPTLSNAPDDDMAAAIAASLQDAGPSTSGADSYPGGGSSHWGGASSQLGGADSPWGGDEDPELAAAIAASLGDSFGEQKRAPSEPREAEGGPGVWSGKGQKLGGSDAPGEQPSGQSGEGMKATSPGEEGGNVTELVKPKFEIKQDALSRQIAAARAKVEARAAASGPATSQSEGGGDVSGAKIDVSAADTATSQGPGDAAGGGVELAFRMLDGRRVSRKFGPGATVGDLLTFLRGEGVDTDKTVLTATGGDKLSLVDSQVTLERAGLQDKSLLTVRQS